MHNALEANQTYTRNLAQSLNLDLTIDHAESGDFWRMVIKSHDKEPNPHNEPTIEPYSVLLIKTKDSSKVITDDDISRELENRQWEYLFSFREKFASYTLAKELNVRHDPKRTSKIKI